MQRTISTMVGKGSVNHNSRKFKAENVDGERSHLNIDYCNEPIKKIYHDLFDEALKRYNDKQTRSDRRIENYYEKIRNSKQEKLFHELILQIGDKENMNAESENGQLARQILDEYYRGFQGRNPQLKVFSAHLHMDEATPHLHIDFVPFTMGSKRGLDTRVSLKQALAAQGFKGGTRGDTEWSQWVSAEKSALAFIMERHGIEWEHKGSHEKHLSVLDYKKQEREKEVTKLGDEINKKKDKLELVNARIGNLIDCEKSLENVKENFEDDPQYQLPEPPALMSAKTYKTKIAQPIINALKELVQGVVIKYFKMKSTLEEWRQANQSLYHDNNRLSEKAKNLENINAKQKAELQDYKLLRKVFGNKQIDDMLKQAKEITQSKQRGTRFRNDKNER
nr:plasmid recombination protein [uncultured Ruminococcus sp.]